MDKNYSDLSILSLITKKSILITSSIHAFINFHILWLNFEFLEIENIINLRTINKNFEFIFYNAKQLEYDFGNANKDYRGVDNFARLLSAQIINNTNKVLFLDSGEIIAHKDLSKKYLYDIKDNYFGWSLEICAGYYYFVHKDNFTTNNTYHQGAVLLIAMRLFREDKLYNKAIFVFDSYLIMIFKIILKIF